MAHLSTDFLIFFATTTLVSSRVILRLVCFYAAQVRPMMISVLLLRVLFIDVRYLTVDRYPMGSGRFLLGSQRSCWTGFDLHTQLSSSETADSTAKPEILYVQSTLPHYSTTLTVTSCGLPNVNVTDPQRHLVHSAQQFPRFCPTLESISSVVGFPPPAGTANDPAYARIMHAESVLLLSTRRQDTFKMYLPPRLPAPSESVGRLSPVHTSTHR